MTILRDSPIETRRKEMPKGGGDWLGYDRCYDRLKSAAKHLAGNEYTRLGQDHIDIMAAMGSGHEETMKYYVHLAYVYKWI
jgi:hypothetical protein